MISKQNLLKQIDAMLDLKKRAVPLLDQHVTAAISFSSLKKEDQDMISEKFRNMVAEQTKHIALLDGIKNSIERGDINAY